MTDFIIFTNVQYERRLWLCTRQVGNQTRAAYGQVTLKAPVPARSPKLSSDEPVQYLDGWPFKQQQVL